MTLTLKQYFEKALLFTFRKTLYILCITLLIYRDIPNINIIWNRFAIYFYNILPYNSKTSQIYPRTWLICIMIIVYIFLINY